MQEAQEFEVGPPPGDGVSSLNFAPVPNAQSLLISSWDASVKLQNVQGGVQVAFRQGGAALDCVFADPGTAFAGGLDKKIYRYDLNLGKDFVMGQHEGPIKCVEFDRNAGTVVTGSWDSTVRVWDPRSPSPMVSDVRQPDKVLTMALTDTRCVVGTAGRHVLVYDLRNMREPEMRRESSLRFQTRCIRTYPRGNGYALSSNEGRVAMEYFDPAEAQGKKYAFKCHRSQASGVDTVYPVNCLAFHPVYGTFASGGCDGFVNVWDGENKKRLCQFHKYPTSIAAMAFSQDGSQLAIASSYTYEEGDRDHPADQVFVRKIADTDVKPKPREPKA